MKVKFCSAFSYPLLTEESLFLVLSHLFVLFLTKATFKSLTASEESTSHILMSNELRAWGMLVLYPMVVVCVSGIHAHTPPTTSPAHFIFNFEARSLQMTRLPI